MTRYRKSAHRRTGFSTPAKGTKIRKLVLMLLRPTGVTHAEVAAALEWAHRGSFNAQLELLETLGGWDIRRFSIPNPNHIDGSGRGKGSTNRMILAYRIVGRHRWKSGYRSFINGAKV